MKALILFLIALGIVTPNNAEAAPGQIRADRVEQAIRSGELTVWEIKQLRADQRALEAYRDKAARDGRVTPKEKAALDYLKREMKQDFQRYTHNNRSR